MSKIVVFLPDGASHAIDLRVKRAHIGRYPSNTVVLADPLVSGIHALLEENESGWWIEDLGSTNGTWINDKRVNSSLLLAEDVLRIGGCTLRLLPAADRPRKRDVEGERLEQEDDRPPPDFDPTDLIRP